MRNRMQDLDFEQTVAFDSVKDFEFTRKAAQKFRQVVSLDSFEDEDADVIFHYLYKEMELVSFGDYLKRYVYERAELGRAFFPGTPGGLQGYCGGIFQGNLHTEIHVTNFGQAEFSGEQLADTGICEA